MRGRKRIIKTTEGKTCVKCGIKLTPKNTHAPHIERSDYRCKDCINAQQRNYTRNLNGMRRKKIIEKLGGKCVHCGYDADIRALQIDHIDGGGSKERRSMSITKYYKLLLQLDENTLFTNYQCLCANCNTIKKYTNNEYYPT